jgi:ATP phosphoribosyltransferase-like protein
VSFFGVEGVLLIPLTVNLRASPVVYGLSVLMRIERVGFSRAVRVAQGSHVVVVVVLTVEVRLGVADAVADVVSTGSTLRQAGLEIFGPVILQSTAVLISRDPEIEGISILLRRLQGVLVAKQYVLMDYDVPARLLEAACLVAPGIESPTVSPLHDPDWVAVRVMVPRSDRNDVMDKLYELGARAILVSAIHAARL